MSNHDYFARIFYAHLGGERGLESNYFESRTRRMQSSGASETDERQFIPSFCRTFDLNGCRKSYPLFG